MANTPSTPALYLERNGGTYILHALLMQATGRQMQLLQLDQAVSLVISADPAQTAATQTVQLTLSNPPTDNLLTVIREGDDQQNFSTAMDTAVDSPPGELDTANVYFSPATTGGCRFVFRTASNRITYDGPEESPPPNQELVKFLLSATEDPTVTYRTYDYMPYQDNGAQYIGGKPRKRRKPLKIKLRKK